MTTVQLSEKASKLVEARRGSRTADQYVNMLIENIYDKMSSSQVIVSGINLFDLLESKNIQANITPVGTVITVSTISAAPAASVPGVPSTPAAASAPAAAAASKIPEIIKQLKASCPGKIPYNLFYQECIERGIPREEIEASTQKNRGLFQIQLYNDDEYAKLLLVIIYDYLKDLYSGTMAASQFYGKCLEEGLTIDDIRFAESVWQISIPDVETLRNLAAKTDAIGIENKLLKLLYAIKTEYPQTIPIAVLHTKCTQFGLVKEDIGQLEKIYTRHLLSKHNQMIAGPGEKKEIKEAPKTSIKEINAKIKRILDETITTYGENVPEMAFIDKCKAIGFALEEQMYARKVLEDYLNSLASYKQIKYMNNKAYIILTSLRKAYPGKIPYNIFYSKCKAIGLKNDEIAEAIKQSGQMISTEKSDEQHYLKVLEGIIAEQKKANA